VISLTGLPPSSVPPNIVTARRTIALGDNFVFTSYTTPAIVLCKFSSSLFSILSTAPDRGAKAPPTFHACARTSAVAIEVPPSSRSRGTTARPAIAPTPLQREPGDVTAPVQR
jgi:hypothetical protein